MGLYFIWTTLILATTIERYNCDNRIVQKQTIEHLLDPAKYDYKIRAYENDTSAPTQVKVSLYVRSVVVDDASMTSEVQLTFRMQWLDRRLHYADLIQVPSYFYLTLDPSHIIWIPDLFFTNEQDSWIHDVIKPNTYIRVFSDGQVIYSARISLKLSCSMNFKLFPLDKQCCPVQMTSYKFTTADLVIKWKDSDPIQMTPDISLPTFSLVNFTEVYCDSHTGTGVHSCLRMNMTFNREFNHYLIHAYIPTMMLVILAWLSFWVSSSHTGFARLLFTLFILMVFVILTSFINATFPVTSYTKAIDVWIGICRTFIFASVVIAVIAVCKNKNENQEPPDDTHLIEPIKLFSPRQIYHRFASCPISKRIDIVARIFYPVLFVLFNVIYWISYLIQKFKSIEPY